MPLGAAGGSLFKVATFRQVPCGRPLIFNRRREQARHEPWRANTEDQGCNNAHPLGLLRGDYYEFGALRFSSGAVHHGRVLKGGPLIRPGFEDPRDPGF